MEGNCRAFERSPFGRSAPAPSRSPCGALASAPDARLLSLPPTLSPRAPRSARAERFPLRKSIHAPIARCVFFSRVPRLRSPSPRSRREPWPRSESQPTRGRRPPRSRVPPRRAPRCAVRFARRGARLRGKGAPTRTGSPGSAALRRNPDRPRPPRRPLAGASPRARFAMHAIAKKTWRRREPCRLAPHRGAMRATGIGGRVGNRAARQGVGEGGREVCGQGSPSWGREASADLPRHVWGTARAASSRGREDRRDCAQEKRRGDRTKRRSREERRKAERSHWSFLFFFYMRTHSVALLHGFLVAEIA